MGERPAQLNQPSKQAVGSQAVKHPGSGNHADVPLERSTSLREVTKPAVRARQPPRRAVQHAICGQSRLSLFRASPCKALFRVCKDCNANA